MSDLGITLAIIAVVGVLYPHVLYPAFLYLISRVASRPLNEGDDLFSIDVCIAAYNEEQYIVQCISSFIESDFPAERMRIRVGDDGSIDKTAFLVEELAAAHPAYDIAVIRFERSGKNAVINGLIQQTTKDIVVFSDADCTIERSALKHLLRPLTDATVGSVVGRTDRTDERVSRDAAEAGEAIHRSLDDFVNTLESSIHSTVTSNGALYAVRRERLESLPDHRVADD